MLDDPAFARHKEVTEEGISLLRSKGFESQANTYQQQLDEIVRCAQPNGDTCDYAGHILSIATLLDNLIQSCRYNRRLQTTAIYLEQRWKQG